jgi:regulator of sirC expression with transglutaminase-like and TPR domain
MVYTTFQDELNRKPIDLLRAALCFAREIAYPDLDVESAVARIDRIAEEGRKVLSPTATVREQAEELADYLFDRIGFQGNSGNYADPRNSFLNEVLDRKLGIPISLSVIYVAVARRLGLPAHGIGLPGHFIVGVEDSQGILYLDPFHGGQRLSVEDCANLVVQTTGYTERFQLGWLDPASSRDILTRMLNNLRSVFLNQKQWAKAAAVVERLRMIQPDIPDYSRDLGVIYHLNGSLQQAIESYRDYLQRAPEASDSEEVKRNMLAVVEAQARLN